MSNFPRLFRSAVLVSAFLSTSPNAEAGDRLDFVRNDRQWPQQVRYKAALPGGSVFFTPDRFVYSYYSRNDMDRIHELYEQKKDIRKEQMHGHAYQVLFVGCNASAPVTGNDRRSYYHNYYLGKDPAHWSAGVPVYGNIGYDELYPGIDLKVYSRGNSMKYDFIAAAGADPSVIRLKFDGVVPKLTRAGTLELRTSVNTVIEQAPYVYQLIGGRKLEVKCHYTIDAGGQVGFAFPEGYNRTAALVIDPTLVFAGWSGSTSENFGACATYDQAGNFYSTSSIGGPGWPVTMGAFQTTPGGGFGMGDIGLNKYNSTGTTLLYSTYLGGGDGDGAINILVNSNNEPVIFGGTGSTDFPTTAGCYKNTITATEDFFVTHFNAAGTALIGSTYIGGTDLEGFGDGDLKFDHLGNIICVSNTMSTDFPVTAGAYQATNHGGFDLCLFKFNPTCSSLLFSTYLGGNNSDLAGALELTNTGNLAVCGGSASTDYPTTPGALQPALAAGTDAFVSVLSANAATLLSSTYLGTIGMDIGVKLQVDISDNIYVAGHTSGNYPVTAGLYTNTDGALFVHKLTSTLGNIVSTRLAANDANMGSAPFAFGVDDCGYVCYAVFTGDTSLPITAGAYQAGPATMYIGQLNSSMTALNYATYLGSLNDGAHSHGQAVFDPLGNLYTSLCMQTFTTTPGVWCPASQTGGVFDGLSFKFKLDPQITDAQFQLNGNDSGCVAYTISFTNNSANAVSYLWEFGDGDTSTAFAPTHTFTAPGIYYVKLTAYNPASCKTSDMDSLPVYVLPTDTVFASSDSNFCHPGSLVLHAPAGYAAYQWQDGSANSSLTVTEGGEFFVVSANMCSRRIDSFSVEKIDLAFSLGPDTVVCAPYLLEGPVIDGAAYLWKGGSTAQRITVQSSGSYWLTVSKKGCSHTDTAVVNYQTNKTKTTDTSFCNDKPVDLVLEAAIPPGATALWSTGSTQPNIRVQLPGTYWVTVTKGTCYKSDTTKVIHEYCDCQLSIPSAFSPNDDGRNDVFRVLVPSACALSGFTMSVYNRWGQRVFVTTDHRKAWDGTFNGVPADQGTYMYVVDGYAGSKGVHKQQTGDVMLVR